LKEAMAVRRHRNQIAPLANRGLRDLSAGVPCRENALRLDAVCFERRRDFLEVLAIFAHFLGFAEMQLTHVPRCPAIRDVNQHERCAAVSRKLSHVSEN
jgi:hypothetical protein